MVGGREDERGAELEADGGEIQTGSFESRDPPPLCPHLAAHPSIQPSTTSAPQHSGLIAQLTCTAHTPNSLCTAHLRCALPTPLPPRRTGLNFRPRAAAPPYHPHPPRLDNPIALPSAPLSPPPPLNERPTRLSRPSTQLVSHPPLALPSIRPAGHAPSSSFLSGAGLCPARAWLQAAPGLQSPVPALPARADPLRLSPFAVTSRSWSCRRASARAWRALATEVS